MPPSLVTRQVCWPGAERAQFQRALPGQQQQAAQPDDQLRRHHGIHSAQGETGAYGFS